MQNTYDFYIAQTILFYNAVGPMPIFYKLIFTIMLNRMPIVYELTNRSLQSKRQKRIVVIRITRDCVTEELSGWGTQVFVVWFQFL